MKIAGIDASINGTGLAIFEVDRLDYKVLKRKYWFFTTKKSDTKLAGKDGKINAVLAEDSESKTERNAKTTDTLRSILRSEGVEYAAIEDYAMGIRNGSVFDIGEFCGLAKHHLYLDGIQFRTYDIPSIKIFATGMGNGNKDPMLLAYKLKGDGTLLIQDKAKSPMSDMIDAHFIADMLRVELGVRAGVFKLQDLPEDQRRIFLRTTKGNPVNLLDKPWNR